MLCQVPSVAADGCGLRRHYGLSGKANQATKHEVVCFDEHFFSGRNVKGLKGLTVIFCFIADRLYIKEHHLAAHIKYPMSRQLAGNRQTF